MCGTRSSTTSTSSATSRRAAPSSSSRRTRCREGALFVLSAHGVAPQVYEKLRGARPPGRRRRLPARLQGARGGAPLRAARPQDRARRPRRPRRGRGDDGRGARLDRPRRDAGGRASARARGRRSRLAYLTQTTLSLDDTAEVVDALRERVPRPRRAALGGHLLRDAEPPGRGQGDLRGGDARPRRRLADELEREPSRRGRAGSGRGGAPDRRRDRPRCRPGSRATRPSGSPPAPRRRRCSSSASSTGSPSSATPSARRSRSPARTSSSGCPQAWARRGRRTPRRAAQAAPRSAGVRGRRGPRGRHGRAAALHGPRGWRDGVRGRCVAGDRRRHRRVRRRLGHRGRRSLRRRARRLD